MSREEQKPYDASDKEQVKERKHAVRRGEDRLRNDTLAVMSTDEGKRFMWWLLGECGQERDSFNTNALVMARNEGQRSIGLLLKIHIAKTCHEKYLEMQLLANKEGDHA